MPTIHVNASALFGYSERLRRMGRSDFPIVVRKTLNEAALDVKQKTMPATSDQNFTKRKPTFWGATSRVDFARGFDINSMQAIVGFVPPTNIKESGHATQDLQEQEYGGDIDKRAFIAGDRARTGKGNVKGGLTLAKLKDHIIDASKEDGKLDSEKFIKAAVKAGYPNGFVIGTGRNAKGNKALLQILSIHRLKAGENKPGVKVGDMVVKTKEIYSVKAKRKAHVHATHFMATAAQQTAEKMNDIFNRHAFIQLNKKK